MIFWNRDDPVEQYTGKGGRKETARANRALNDYIMLGPTRSIRALLKAYENDPAAPTHRFGTISQWSSIFDWIARAVRFDQLTIQREQSNYIAARQAIMDTGFALTHERVQLLKTSLADLLATLDIVRPLVPDLVAKISAGASVDGLETTIRSTMLFHTTLRAYLDDLARETGGRNPKTIIENVRPQNPTPKPDFSNFTQQEIETLVQLMYKANP